MSGPVGGGSLRGMAAMALLVAAAAVATGAATRDAVAEPPGKPMPAPAAPPPAPRVLLVSQAAWPVGKPLTVTLRGTALDTLTGATVIDPANGQTCCVVVSVSQNQKAPPPNNELPERWGDSTAQLKLTLPAQTVTGPLALVVHGPGGSSPPLAIWAAAARPGLTGQPPQAVMVHALERDDNNRLDSPQPLIVPATVDGAIAPAGDVDVLAWASRPGQRWTIEVFAGRHGSLLDPRLVINAGRRRLAVADDTPGLAGGDARLTVTHPDDLPAGPLMVIVSDAHQTSSPYHHYRLVITAAGDGPP